MKSLRSSLPTFLDRVLVWAASLGFYVWCMMLPLVGRSGAAAPQARLNLLTSLGILILSLALTIYAARRLRARVGKGARALRVFAAVQLLCMLLLVLGAFAK